MSKKVSTKSKLRKEKIKNNLKYFNPTILEEEVSALGYKTSKAAIIEIFFLLAVLGVIVSLLFRVQWATAIVMVAISIIFVPKLILNHYHELREDKRFHDVNTYIEQFLYSFINTKVIATTIQDIRTEFIDSPMIKTIDQAISIINKENDIEKALQVIYDAYPSQKVKSMHKFALTAERLGGDYSKTIELLNQDRVAWESRKQNKIMQKKHIRMMIIAASAITIGICAIFLSALPENYDIAHNVFVQIAAVVMWFTDMFCYAKADSQIVKGVLEENDTYDKKTSLRRYKSIMEYDERLERKTSLKLAIIPAIVVVVGIAAQKVGVIIIALAVMLFFLYQHTIGHKLVLKQAKREIEAVFPEWMMEVALLLQTNSVKSSLYLSIPNAPYILREELTIFYDNINKYPHAIEPYILFMRDFDIPQITSAMKMLYAIAEGEGGNADDQIAEIIRKNNEMLDAGEKIKDEDALAALGVFYLVPSLIGAGKLLVDMMVFLVVTMLSMQSNI